MLMMLLPTSMYLLASRIAVEIEMAPERVGRELLDRLEVVHAGVVDQHIDSPVGRMRRREHARDRGLVAHVGLHSDRVTAGADDVRHHAISRVGTAGVVDDDLRAFRTEAARDRRAQSFGGAGDHGHLALKSVTHVFSLMS
jgi:hypothetical protein